MKNKKLIRAFTVLLAALVIMGGFSVTAYAGGGEEYDYSEPEQTAEPEEETGGYEPQPLTPEGNMTLVDDITGDAAGDKQFITVVTKNGNYFYVIIDRAAEGENTVHFLNQVDEADLMALMEDGQTEAPAVCNCTEKCVAGSVNAACPVCKNSMSECAGKEATPAEPEQPDEPEKEKSGAGGILLVVLLLAAAGGGAFYYFKIMKPKKDAAQGSTELDDYDFDEDEETEEVETDSDIEQEDEDE